MKRQSVGKNYFFNILNEIVSLLIPLITTPYICSTLGAAGTGAYSVAINNVTYFAVFATLGTTVYGRREIAYKQNNKYERSVVFYELMLFRFITIVIAICAYLVYVMFFSYGILELVMILQLISVYTDITWFYQGMEQFGKLAIRNISIKLLGVIYIFTFVKTKEDVVSYAIGFLAFSLAANVVMLIGTKNYLCSVPVKILRPFRHIKSAIALFIPTIATQLYQALDKSMIGAYTETDVENGYYEQAQKLIRICWTFVTTFAVVMSPRIALAYAEKRKEDLRLYVRRAYQFVWFLSIPIVFGLCAVTDNLVPWFFGAEFEKVKILLYIFSLIVLPMGLNAIGGQYLVATKQQRVFNISVVSGTVFNFILNIFLISNFYSIGAAIASVCAEYLILFIQIIYILKSHSFDVLDVFTGFVKYLSSGLIMFAIVKTISLFFNSKAPQTLLLVIIGGITYIGILTLLKDDMIHESIEIVKKKIGKREI